MRTGRELLFFAAEIAIGGVVVDHAGCLHEGVEGGGADEVEAGFAEGFGHGVRRFGAGWVIGDGFEGVALRFFPGEAPEPLDGVGDLQPCESVLADGEDFSTVADDAGVEDE